MILERTGSGIWVRLGRLSVALSWFENNWHLSIAWSNPPKEGDR